MKYTSHSIEETETIARDFVLSLSPKNNTATVVGLYGNLGAGKTAFTKYIASVLGIEETITSPTFVIEKIYGIAASSQKLEARFTHLIHIDAYRLKGGSELLKLGWEEIISDKNNLILIEWPEIVADVMPVHIQVRFETLEGDTKREIEIVV